MTRAPVARGGVRAGYGPSRCSTASTSTCPPGRWSPCSGPNGAGKTTLLSVLAGLHPPPPASVVLAGRRVNGARPDDLARAGLCLIPEGRGIFPNLTVHEHLRMATHSGRRPRPTSRRRPTSGSRASASGGRRWPARCPAASSRCWPSPAGSPPARPCSCSTSCRWAWPRSSSRSCTPRWPRSPPPACRSSSSSSSPRTVLGVADLAAVLVQGRIGAVGPPEDIEAELSAAYLGAVVDRRRTAMIHPPRPRRH